MLKIDNQIPHIFLVRCMGNRKMWTTFANLEDLINCKCKSIVEHSGQKFLKQRWRFIKTRVRIDLNKPRIALFIEHKVIAKDLKAVTSIVFIEFLSDTQHAYFHYISDFTHYIVHALAVFFDQLSQMLKAKLISILVFSVIVSVLLNSVVGQMNV